MGRAYSMAEVVNGLNQLGLQFPSMNNKSQLAKNFNADPETFNNAFQFVQNDLASKLGSTKLSLSMEDAIYALMNASPSVTPAMAADMLIEKGADPDDVKFALQHIDMDKLDNIDGKADSMIDPYMQDAEHAYQHNRDKIEEVDSTIIEDLLRFIKRNPYISDGEIEKYLETKHDLASQQCRAIIRMIHLAEDKLEKVSRIVDERVLADMISGPDGLGANPTEAMSALNSVGIDPEIIHRSLKDQFKPQQTNDRPNPLENANMVGGPGTEQGPTEDLGTTEGLWNPSAQGSGNNNVGASTGGNGPGSEGESYPQGEGDITSPKNMNELNEEMRSPTEPDASGPARGEREILNDIVEKNYPPDVEERILADLGATQTDLRNKATQRKKEKAGKMRATESKDSGIKVGSTVSYKGENHKVAGTTSTLYGDMIVLSNGEQVMADDELLGPAIKEKKEASAQVTFEKLMEKSSKFFEREYHYTEDDLKKMAKKADKLIDEISSYEPTKISEAVGLREQSAMLRTASATFKEAAERQALENKEYLESQPQYHVGMVAQGHDFGPGGGDAIVITASEMEQEHEELLASWPKEAAVIASQLVEENSQFVGSAGDMRRIASRVIDGKFAHLDADTQDEVRSNFLGFVEKARRIALRELPKKEARVERELPHDYDEGVFY